MRLILFWFGVCVCVHVHAPSHLSLKAGVQLKQIKKCVEDGNRVGKREQMLIGVLALCRSTDVNRAEVISLAELNH